MSNFISVRRMKRTLRNAEGVPISDYSKSEEGVKQYINLDKVSTVTPLTEDNCYLICFTAAPGINNRIYIYDFKGKLKANL